MITAVDTNVLLDLLIPGAKHAETSEVMLDQAHRDGRVIAPEVVYAELAASFSAREGLDGFIANTGLEIVPSMLVALFSAGEAWKTYTRRRPRNAVECPDCGRSQEVPCGDCGKPISWRQHMVADFLVGGHALHHADRLATRDLGFYKTYFPTLRLLVS